MNATVTKVSITTTKAPEFIDITEHVIAHVENSGVRDGLVSIYSIHTTCAIKINENEPYNMCTICHTSVRTNCENARVLCFFTEVLVFEIVLKAKISC